MEKFRHIKLELNNSKIKNFQHLNQNHTRSVQHEVLHSWLINTVYHSIIWGEGKGGLKRGGVISCFSWGGERAYLKGGSWMEDFRYLFEDHKFISAHYNFQVLPSLDTVSTRLHTICNINFQSTGQCQNDKTLLRAKQKKSLKLSQFAFNAEGNVPYWILCI